MKTHLHHSLSNSKLRDVSQSIIPMLVLERFIVINESDKFHLLGLLVSVLCIRDSPCDLSWPRQCRQEKHHMEETRVTSECRTQDSVWVCHLAFLLLQSLWKHMSMYSLPWPALMRSKTCKVLFQSMMDSAQRDTHCVVCWATEILGFFVTSA